MVHKFNNGTLDDTNDIERYFAEFINNGGETGFTQLNTVDNFKHLTELCALRHRLGNSYLTAMVPLTHANDTDQWVLNELL
ncbi:MAG: hypothetical protein Q4E55_05005 [Bacteroidales bacterium]|nr:hypothetical protein [Bacteroidales bacterium]